MKFPRMFRNINEDADAELRYWMNGLFAALGAGVAFALLAGGAAWLGADAEGDDGARFVHDFWPWLVECAFWFGMLLGMLWSAGRRIGSGLAGSLPWQPANGLRDAFGRRCAQGAAFAALLAFAAWFTGAMAAASGAFPAALVAGLDVVASAALAAAGGLAAAALALRLRKPGPSGSTAGSRS